MSSGLLKTFTALTPFIKFKSNKISIDNLVFKFHYRATFLLLLVCTLLVTSRQYIGEHIRCISGNAIPEKVINTFCFFTSTFTVVRHLNETSLNNGWIPHPGIGSMHPEDEVKHHAYYQWVPFVLFGQALMFYMPHFLWRIWEGGRIKGLVEGLQMVALSKHNQKKTEMRLSGNYVLPSKEMIDSRIHFIKNDFYKHIRVNKKFASRLLLCEAMNLINVLLQVYATNAFLGGNFYSLGLKFIEDDFVGALDVLDVVFPKVTKCNFFKYGSSGSIQHHDALCIMALNIINEKIYIVLWFWFWILFLVTVAGAIWRFATLILFSSSVKLNKIVFLSVCPGRINTKHLMTVNHHISYSDWIFLYYLAKNMEPYVFSELLADLADEFRRNYINEHGRLSEKPNANEIDERETIELEDIDQVDLRRK